MSFFSLPDEEPAAPPAAVAGAGTADESAAAYVRAIDEPVAKRAKTDDAAAPLTLVAYEEESEEESEEEEEEEEVTQIGPWEKLWNEEYETYYYNNTETSTSTWDPSEAGFPTDEEVAAKAAAKEARAAARAEARAARAAEAEADDDEPEFVSPYHFTPCTVSISNLPDAVTDDDVANYFGQCGPISKIWRQTFDSDDPTLSGGRRPPRRVNITFASEDAATAAVWCNGVEWSGREMRVMRSKHKTYESVAQPDKVCVRGVPVTATHQDIEDFFSESGCLVQSIQKKRKDDDGLFNGMAIVTFATASAATQAVAKCHDKWLRASGNSRPQGKGKDGVLAAASKPVSAQVSVEPSSVRRWTGATSGRPAGHFQRGGLQKGEREERGGGGGAEKRPENCMTVWIGNLAKVCGRRGRGQGAGRVARAGQRGRARRRPNPARRGAT